jgi:hypothetical protein
MAKNTLRELSDLIFELGEKLPDADYKKALDLCGELHKQNTQVNPIAADDGEIQAWEDGHAAVSAAQAEHASWVATMTLLRRPTDYRSRHGFPGSWTSC